MLLKIYKFISHVKFGVILLLVYALATAIATFIENDYGTPSANWLVYKSIWFNILHFFLLVNFVLVAKNFKMYQLKKLSIFAFHAGFVIVILGAAITRFFSYEGVMHIREGEKSNSILTYNTLVEIGQTKGDNTDSKKINADFNQLSGGQFDVKTSINNQNISIKMQRFIPNASEEIIEDKSGKTIISFTLAGQNGREDVYIKEGEIKTFSGQKYNFTKKPIDQAINIVSTDSGMFFTLTDTMVIKHMSDTIIETYASNILIPVQNMKLYTWANYQMVVSKIYPFALTQVNSQKDKDLFPLDALELQIEGNNHQQIVYVYGKSTYYGQSVDVLLGDETYQVRFGADKITLPFSIQLDDFKLERYHGSMSPASYESYITLIDSINHSTEKHRIFMNNVLQFNGLRFYQSSYDSDEMGTILSVNKDYWGTMITYIGYFLLSLGMFINIFDKNSRFRFLAKQVSSIDKTVVVFLMLFAFGINNQVNAQVPIINPVHAEKFGQLQVQDQGGRIKPINTLAHETIRKLSRRSAYKDLNPNQILLSMMLEPKAWSQEPILKVKNPDLAKLLNASPEGFVTLASLFDDEMQYKLGDKVEQAYAKSPARQDQFDKAIIKLDEMVNILYMTLSGDFLNIFPLRGDSTHKWHNLNSGLKAFRGEDSTFVYNVYRMYMLDLQDGIKTGNWQKADSTLSYIKQNQDILSKPILMSPSKLKAEIFYNESAIFRHLFEFYFITGLAFLALLFAKLLFNQLRIKYLIWTFVGILSLAFLLHTFGLGLRWYISGHAPWSNGYESMIYISWATMLAGFLFSRSSTIALAATTVLSGMILLVAHLSWIDPEITNLVPVLQSYWLTIHVAVITASYGFLALGALLGFINMLILIMTNTNNKERLDIKIKQLTYINEMSLIAGLFLLSIGTFLGGVWANESWGRYWGWDSKETWALITMLIYAIILHIRFVPKMKSLFTFNLLSLLALSTVIMTYFGVNYYLSGLHSYAKGDPVPIPDFVYYTLAVIAIISAKAYYKFNNFKTRD